MVTGDLIVVVTGDLIGTGTEGDEVTIETTGGVFWDTKEFSTFKESERLFLERFTPCERRWSFLSDGDASLHTAVVLVAAHIVVVIGTSRRDGVGDRCEGGDAINRFDGLTTDSLPVLGELFSFLAVLLAAVFSLINTGVAPFTFRLQNRPPFLIIWVCLFVGFGFMGSLLRKTSFFFVCERLFLYLEDPPLLPLSPALSNLPEELLTSTESLSWK